jgi:hypothetical protein
MDFSDCPPECVNNQLSSKLTPLEITLIVVALVFLFLLIFGGLNMLKKVKKMKNQETF